MRIVWECVRVLCSIHYSNSETSFKFQFCLSAKCSKHCTHTLARTHEPTAFALHISIVIRSLLVLRAKFSVVVFFLYFNVLLTIGELIEKCSLHSTVNANRHAAVRLFPSFYSFLTVCNCKTNLFLIWKNKKLSVKFTAKSHYRKKKPIEKTTAIAPNIKLLIWPCSRASLRFECIFWLNIKTNCRRIPPRQPVETVLNCLKHGWRSLHWTNLLLRTHKQTSNTVRCLRSRTPPISHIERRVQFIK